MSNETPGPSFKASSPREAAMIRLFFKEQRMEFKEISNPSKNGTTLVHFLSEDFDNEMFELVSMELEEKMERDKEFRREFEELEEHYRATYWKSA